MQFLVFNQNSEIKKDILKFKNLNMKMKINMKKYEKLIWINMNKKHEKLKMMGKGERVHGTFAALSRSSVKKKVWRSLLHESLQFNFLFLVVFGTSSAISQSTAADILSLAICQIWFRNGLFNRRSGNYIITCGFYLFIYGLFLNF